MSRKMVNFNKATRLRAEAKRLESLENLIIQLEDCGLVDNLT